MDLIKTALKESGVDGNSYYCGDNGQEGGYMFLTCRQYGFIKENSLDLVKAD